MGKGSKSIIGKRKRGREEGTAGDEGSDEEFRGEGPKKAKLPKAEEGVATKARVWVRSLYFSQAGLVLNAAYRNGERSDEGESSGQVKASYNTSPARGRCAASA